jgi:hypothetical protein
MVESELRVSVSRLDDKLGPVDADRHPAPVVLELRGAEPARRHHQRDLVVGLSRRGHDLLGNAVERFTGGFELGRTRLQARHGANPRI